jgi:hypothetical protein
MASIGLLRVLLCCAIAASLSPLTRAADDAPDAAASRPTGIDTEQFGALFLAPGDLGPDMELKQDSRNSGPDSRDAEFGRRRGVRAGFVVWMSHSDSPVWRLVDVRWVFPSARLADEYLRAALRSIMEGQPLVPGAESVGEGCRVGGGTRPTPFGTQMTAFVYAFRVENVVVKLFVAQNPQLELGTLKTADVAAIARTVVRRIEGVARSEHKPSGG